MKKTLKLFLVATLFLLAVAVPTTVYFWKLAQQWPPAIPNPGYTVPPSMKFTIQGLWAEDFIGPWPAPPWPVPQTPFKSALINCHMYRRMRVSRLDVKHGAHEMFWNYVWHTHGGCSESLYDQVAFFTIALDLKDRFDLVEILNAAQMHQSFSVPLDLGNLNATIMATLKTSIMAAAPVLLYDLEYHQYFSERGEILQGLHICFPIHILVIDCQICFELVSVVIHCPPQNSPPFIFLL